MFNLRKIKLTFLIILLLSLFCLYNWTSTKIIVRDFIYLTRPVWDNNNGKPFKVIPHYYTYGLNSSQLCRLHGWQRSTQEVQVIDTIIFSIELDLLEIRLKELWPFVDHFIVLEANRTFTGRQKPLYLNNSLHQFLWAKDKLRYHFYEGLQELEAGEDPFKNEGKMRKFLNKIVSKYARNGDVIICSDVDEMPSRQTAQLIKECTGYPTNMNLMLRMYLYSFEFFLVDDQESRSAHITLYNDTHFQYTHGRHSDYLLADSGWHCSFCFRHISDFIFKMTSYSHNDRVIDPKVLNRNEIQRKICDGKNIYDMLPEFYTIQEMIVKLAPISKSKAMTHLPKHLIQNPEKFRFLLPDGCVRQDFNQTIEKKP